MPAILPSAGIVPETRPEGKKKQKRVPPKPEQTPPPLNRKESFQQVCPACRANLPAGKEFFPGMHMKRCLVLMCLFADVIIRTTDHCLCV
jgi:putative SOS response-associated peptidase YedK